MYSDHKVLLFYTKIRWLSKENVAKPIFELKDELKTFLDMQGKRDCIMHFIDELWFQRVAYLLDIFAQLNKLNLKFQGNDMRIIHFKDYVQAFILPSLATGHVKQIL